MKSQDKCCTLVPYFLVHRGQMAAFRALCERYVERTREEPGCLYCGFSFGGDLAHCREGYVDADGLLAHLENVHALLNEALELAILNRLEIHGPDEELAKLRDPLAGMQPRFFSLEYGFRR